MRKAISSRENSFSNKVNQTITLTRNGAVNENELIAQNMAQNMPRSSSAMGGLAGAASAAPASDHYLGTFLDSPKRKKPQKSLAVIADPQKRRKHLKRYTFFLPPSNVKIVDRPKIIADPYRIDPYDDKQIADGYKFVETQVKLYLEKGLTPVMWDKKLPGKKTLSKLRFWGLSLGTKKFVKKIFSKNFFLFFQFFKISSTSISLCG